MSGGAAPRRVYADLLKAYGPRGWWPVTVSRRRGPVYRPGFQGRLSSRQRAEVCVGAILTQNAAWTNVVKALACLHAAGLRDLESLARCRSARLARLIRSSGYFRQKARKLKAFARHALARGPLERWLGGAPLPALREELLSLWGVGPETADSILLYAGGREAFVADAYTLRLGRRLGWFGEEAGYEEAQSFLIERLPRDARLYAEVHALIVEHAKRHCRAKPSCPGCPLKPRCHHGQETPRA